MMLFFLSAALLACVAAIPSSNSLVSNDSHHWMEFGKFMQKYEKSYSSVEEYSSRFSIFKNWSAYIESHNAIANKSYELAVNKFADLSLAEIKSTYLGYRSQNRIRHYEKIVNTSAVTAIDWRAKGCVNAVRDQGNCGSCWAFSAIASLECANFLKSGKLPILSVQQLVDCSGQSGDSGCDGGLMDNAFNYVQNVSLGVDTDTSYPYTAKTGQCMFNEANIAGTCSGHFDVARNDENALQVAVTGRVVSAAINSDFTDFHFYKGGIYDNPNCPTDDPDHGVAIVGFDSIAGYWIVRNTWGADWGENGYVRMAMGKSICGLAGYASYPIA
jgi:hypothetical protein